MIKKLIKHFLWLRKHDTDSCLRWDNRFLENRRKWRIPKATLDKNCQLKELKEQFNLNLISFDDYFFQVRKICDFYKKTHVKKKKRKTKKRNNGQISCEQAEILQEPSKNIEFKSYYLIKSILLDVANKL